MKSNSNPKVLIIEDDIVFSLFVETLLPKDKYEIVGLASTLKQAEAMINGYKPDILISDICLDKEDIFMLANQEHIREIPIILMTSHTEKDYFIKYKKFKKSMYLIKPFHPHTLLSCLDLMVQTHLNKEKKKIVLRGNLQQIIEINVDDIVLIKSESNYSFIFTKSGRKYIRKKSLSTYDDELNNNFVRIHKSYIVNKKYITEMDFINHKIQVLTHSVPVGRSYRKVFNQLIDSELYDISSRKKNSSI